MAPTNLLDLPIELLHSIFTNLSWDRSVSLTPWRPDIVSISLTCHRLRHAVLPVLFQDVTLKLRWVDYVLVEPGLFRLRQQRPDLARHVRCVFIETQFGQRADHERQLNAFAAPEGLQDWLKPDGEGSQLSRHEDRSMQSHRRQVSVVAKSVFENPDNSDLFGTTMFGRAHRTDDLVSELLKQFQQSPGAIAQPPRPTDLSGDELAWETLPANHAYLRALSGEAADTTPATTRTSQKRRSERLRMQLDALCLVMLCLPMTINSLVFEALPTYRADMQQLLLALHVARMSLKLFSDRLQSLTWISDPAADDQNLRPERVLHPDDTASGILTAAVLEQLTQVSTLTLADYDTSRGTIRSIFRNLSSPDSRRWHLLSNLTHLHFRNTTYDPTHLHNFISPFTHLRTLTLHNVRLQVVTRRPANDSNQIWLNTLIALRRSHPNLKFHLSQLRGRLPTGAEDLSPSAVAWLLHEAVPTKAVISFERETRLLEDFVNFLSLWRAEDSERGRLAGVERERDGALVDLAMGSRGAGIARGR